MDVTNFPGLSEYLDHIKSRYATWALNLSEDNRQEFIDEFNNGLRVVALTKYIKVITRNTVHSFICLNDMGKFTKGDILKAESWTSPAKNFARGNTMSRSFGAIDWPGA